MYAAIAKSSYARDIAAQCHHDWFAEAGYIRPTDDGRYTDEFTPRSVHFLVYKDFFSRENVMGMVRLVVQPPFRTLEQFDIYDEYAFLYDAPHVMESSALCWDNACALQAIPHLYRALFQYGFAHRAQHIICNLDTRVLAISTRKFKMPLRQCGEPREFMNSLKAPVLISQRGGMQQMQENNPMLWDIFSQPLDRSV